MTGPYGSWDRASFMAEMRASFAVARPSAMTIVPSLPDGGGIAPALQPSIEIRASEAIEPGAVYVIGPEGGRRTILYHPRDRYGYPSAAARIVKPSPLWTRHMVGAHEAARDWRLHRRLREAAAA